MAELVVSMVVKPVLSSLMSKLSSYLLVQYNVLDGMEKQHAILKRKLPAILDVINDAEHVATHRDGARAWLQALKTVAAEANDIFDEFHYEACRRQAKNNNHNWELGLTSLKLCPTHNRLMFHSRMSRRLKIVVQNIDVLFSEMKAFKFKYQRQGLESNQNRLTDSVIVDPADIIRRSRHADKEKIVKILTAPARASDGKTTLAQLIFQHSANLLVLAIVGMSGLGKTTLAQLIFNDQNIHNYFEVQKWVCVSEDFDARYIARQIYEGSAEMDTDKALMKLRAELSGKKFLVVLDDVWNKNTDKWEKLKACLQHGAAGSAVLVTTRSKEVAAVMHTVEDHDLAALEKNFIKEIIETRATNLQHATSSDQNVVDNYAVLLSMLDNFADRCAGSPLAAKAIGSMLRTKRDPEEWKIVLSESNICNMGDDIFQILKLSFDDLPSDVRQCFTFCAMFPKGRPIPVKNLIQLWIANGFIQGNGHLETIGEQIFEELASRSFFEDVKQVSSCIVPSVLSSSEYVEQVPSYIFPSIVSEQYHFTCRIHDLMHDIAASSQEKECYTMIKSSSLVDCPDTAQHLYLAFPARIASSKIISPVVKTIICKTPVRSPVQHLPHHVRALQFCSESFPIKPNHLYLLRYLDLSMSWITALPEDITILYHLQVLNLSGCEFLVRLLRLMRYMTSLRHLDTFHCYSLEMMPQDLGKLTALQTLSWFVASTSSGCSTIRELQHLNLCGQLVLLKLENVTEEDSRAANLRQKLLRHLTLQWTLGCEDNTNVIEALEPHDVLQTLRICSYGGSTCPTWMRSLKNLVQLCIWKCENIQFLISGSWFSFPNLKELRLHLLPVLESLWGSNGMEVEQILFPKLEMVHIQMCPKLTMLHGPATFPNLVQIRIESCPEMRTPFEAPKVSTLHMEGTRQQIVLWAARYLNSLIKLNLKISCTEITSADHAVELMVFEQKGNSKYPLSQLVLYRFAHPEAINLCSYFTCMEKLCLHSCHSLVYWPEEFQSLVALRQLEVYGCKYLIGRAHLEPSTSEASQLVPNLVSLLIHGCHMLTEIFKVPNSVRCISILFCRKIASVGREHFFPPSLQSLTVKSCSGLAEILELPLSLEELTVEFCAMLKSLEFLSGVLSLKILTISFCKTISSLPDGLQASPSLKIVDIVGCYRIKRLPTFLKNKNVLAP